MDFQQEFHATNIHSFDEFEYDDDVFYSELRRQVLQLTAEDDEREEVQLYENKNPNTVTTRKPSANIGPFGFSQERGYDNWPVNEEDHSAPAWILNSRRIGNGTGVFIPQVVQSRRKNRPRRKKNERGRTYKRVDEMN
ncbi:hypothetical protein CDL12_03579 [Handroanthus impetiginosus]|uniref:Uncharacterized protein n=1 Tax=Handroanthus impetiginosus TaxID=429701 RepID=A0A2G9I1Q6_9LAMI|nr:hypothetical protein CDL12_03579 [Handroanthus impetiginosus]